MFDLRALKLLTAFAVVATSVLAQDHSSEQSEAQITGAHHHCLFFCHSSLIKRQIRTSSARCILTGPLPRTSTTSRQYGSLRPCSRTTDGQALWSKIAGGVPNIAPKGQLNGSTTNETYDSANDPDCCEWAFFVPRSAIRGRGRESVGSRTPVPYVDRVLQPAVSLCSAISEAPPRRK